MIRKHLDSILIVAGLLAIPCALHAQYGTGKSITPQKNNAPAAKSDAPPAPAPVHDLSGVWMMRNPQGSNGGAYTLDQTNDPVLTRCYPPGTPRVYFHPYPFEFVQAPKFMLMVFEYDHTIRRIYTDGRPLPDDPDPTWMGYSVGRWDGNTTFVVDTVGFNEKTWLDRLGAPHNE